MNAMIKAFFTSCLILIQVQLFAQVYNFNSGEIPANWYGNSTDFTINTTGELQLHAAAGTTAASLSWPMQINENVSWEFLIRYDFAASTTNYANFYLLSTTPDTGASTNSSYYLKIGGESGSTDKLELIFQAGTTRMAVLASPTGIVGGNVVAVRIRICKLMNGEWLLFADMKGGREFVKIASGIHFSNARFLSGGIQCLYTSTRRDKFYFDDIIIEEPFAIRNLEFTKEDQLEITFTKQLKSLADEQLFIDLGQTYELDFFENKIELKTHADIDPGEYTARLFNIESIYSDTLLSSKFNIQKAMRYYPGQLRITEWMSNPSLSYGLPDIEWMEIMNVSNTCIEIDQLSISDPVKKVTLPPYSLKKDSIVVLCSAGGCIKLGIRNCVEANALPSLNNSADSLFLWANDSILIDYIEYDLSVLPNDYRKDGGYSIVRKSIPQPCFYEQELEYSSEQKGASPGYTSGFAVAKQASLTATANFITEKQACIDLNMVGNILNQYISADISIQSVSNLRMPYTTRINVVFDKPVSQGKAVILQLDSIKTCLNEIQHPGMKIKLIYPKSPGKNELYINEILYNAFSGGVDFVELYNTTKEYIALENTHLIYIDPKGKEQHMFIKNNQLIYPEGYMVLTGDTAIVKRQYPDTYVENCIQIAGFISLGDDGGTLTLTNKDSDTLDKIVFNDALQNPLNRNDEGISLEKIDTYKTYFTRANWTSSAMGATPGYTNSQNLLVETDEAKLFYCRPCHVTTDLNGTNDYALLYLNPGVTGAFASVSIYNLAGELVDNVCVNQLLGTENIFQWNGSHHSYKFLSDGIYIAVAEWWFPDGKTSTAKIALSTSQY